MTFFKPEIKRRDSTDSVSSYGSRLSISDVLPSPDNTDDEVPSEDEWAMPEDDCDGDEEQEPSVFNLN